MRKNWRQIFAVALSGTMFLQPTIIRANGWEDDLWAEEEVFEESDIAEAEVLQEETDLEAEVEWTPEESDGVEEIFFEEVGSSEEEMIDSLEQDAFVDGSILEETEAQKEEVKLLEAETGEELFVCEKKA